MASFSSSARVKTSFSSPQVKSSSTLRKNQIKIDMDVDWELSERSVSIIDFSDSEAEEDVDVKEECDDFENVESLVNNLPGGMEIDLCPSGSIRCERMKELVDDIEFVNEFGYGDDSDSDDSVDLDGLENPRLIQRVMKRPEYSFRRKQLANSIHLLDNSKLWTESIVILHKLPDDSEGRSIIYKKEDSDMTGTMPSLKLEKVPKTICTNSVKEENAETTVCLADDDDKLMNIFEEKNLVKPRIWKKITDDPFNMQFQHVSGKTFHKRSKKFE